ncbi:MAG: hypothetical protein OXH69_10375 [Acidobacteria bacterium]|nr:hypothetical protein [Acidobacteriota bacterium]
MRNITVSVDDETHRRARIRAAELDTSVSALVRGFLDRLARDRTDGGGVPAPDAETERERRERLLNEVFEDIRATRSGFRAADNVSREALYDRNAVRRHQRPDLRGESVR